MALGSWEYVKSGLFYSQKARILKKIPEINAYADESKYLKTVGYSGIRVVGFNSPLYFANGDLFLRQVYTLSDTKPERVRKQIKRLGSIHEFRRQSSLKSLESITSIKSASSTKSGTCQGMDDENGYLPTSNDLAPSGRPVDTGMADCGYVHHIVLDCSSICFIDTVGAKILTQLIDDYKSIHVTVLLANLCDSVWSVLEKTKFVEKHGHQTYMTVEDAVMAARLAAPSEERKLQVYLETINEEPEPLSEILLITEHC